MLSPQLQGYLIKFTVVLGKRLNQLDLVYSSFPDKSYCCQGYTFEDFVKIEISFIRSI